MNVIRSWAIMFFIALFSVCTVRSIELKKLFHHKGGAAHHQGKSIEMGSIVLYLDQYPNVLKTSSKNGVTTQLRFFLPSVQATSKQVQDMVNEINQSKSQSYQLSIAMKSKPSMGMEITLAYNDKEIGVAHSKFDAITLDKGIVVRLYDKKFIKRIGKESKPIIQTAANSRPQIVIDCGHGGTDNGAIGCNKVKEKDLCLDIGLQVAQLLKRKNFDVALTRDNDRTLTLSDRTGCANNKSADLFLSIHANSGNPKASGIETFCLKNSLFSSEDAQIADQDTAFFFDQLKQKFEKSNKLAASVHDTLLASIPKEHSVIDRRVKHAASQVLIGTTMPAILIEVGFITHEKEAALLASSGYQASIAHGIVQGVSNYLSYPQRS